MLDNVNRTVYRRDTLQDRHHFNCALMTLLAHHQKTIETSYVVSENACVDSKQAKTYSMRFKDGKHVWKMHPHPLPRPDIPSAAALYEMCGQVTIVVFDSALYTHFQVCLNPTLLSPAFYFPSTCNL